MSDDERAYIFIDEEGHIVNTDSFVKLMDFLLVSLESHRLVMLEMIEMIKELSNESSSKPIGRFYNKN